MKKNLKQIQDIYLDSLLQKADNTLVVAQEYYEKR